jgi:hypothetical protein
MIEPWIIELLKDSPAYGAIIAIVWLGMKWHERISMQWVAQIKEINDQQRIMQKEWLESIKEIGEKCHDAHEKVSNMYYDQSCKVLEAWTKLNVHMEHFARAVDRNTP